MPMTISLNNWRARRYAACRILGRIDDIIDHLGVETDVTIFIDNNEDKQIVNDKIKHELKNQTALLLRSILLFNDGNVSNSKLNSF